MKKVIIFAFIICLIALVIFYFAYFNKTPGYVEIITPNLHNSYSIQKDNELVIKGEIGELKVQISNKRVRISESSCPNQICVKTGWISRVGEVIICAPNKVSVIIKSSR